MLLIILPKIDTKCQENVTQVFLLLQQLTRNENKQQLFECHSPLLIPFVVSSIRSFKKEASIVRLICPMLVCLEVYTDALYKFIGTNGSCDLLIQCIRYHLHDNTMDIVANLVVFISKVCTESVTACIAFTKASNCFDVLLSVLHFTNIHCAGNLNIQLVQLLIVLVKNSGDGVKKLWFAQYTFDNVHCSWLNAVAAVIEASEGNVCPLSQVDEFLRVVLAQLPRINVHKADSRQHVNRSVELIETWFLRDTVVSQRYRSNCGVELEEVLQLLIARSQNCQSLVNISEVIDTRSDAVDNVTPVDITSSHEIDKVTKQVISLNLTQDCQASPDELCVIAFDPLIAFHTFDSTSTFDNKQLRLMINALIDGNLPKHYSELERYLMFITKFAVPSVDDDETLDIIENLVFQLVTFVPPRHKSPPSIDWLKPTNTEPRPQSSIRDGHLLILFNWIIQRYLLNIHLELFKSIEAIMELINHSLTNTDKGCQIAMELLHQLMQSE